MKVAIIGSRSLTVNNLEDYLPDDIDEIISGGARGIDTCAEKYALENGIKLTVYKPDYEKYQRRAPILRNKTIVENSDLIIAFWDGKSRGTKFVIDYAQKLNKKLNLNISVG